MKEIHCAHKEELQKNARSISLGRLRRMRAKSGGVLQRSTTIANTKRENQKVREDRIKAMKHRRRRHEQRRHGIPLQPRLQGMSLHVHVMEAVMLYCVWCVAYIAQDFYESESDDDGTTSTWKMTMKSEIKSVKRDRKRKRESDEEEPDPKKRRLQ